MKEVPVAAGGVEKRGVVRSELKVVVLLHCPSSFSARTAELTGVLREP